MICMCKLNASGISKLTKNYFLILFHLLNCQMDDDFPFFELKIIYECESPLERVLLLAESKFTPKDCCVFLQFSLA